MKARNNAVILLRRTLHKGRRQLRVLPDAKTSATVTGRALCSALAASISLALLVILPVVASANTYQIDDGSAEIGAANSAGGDFIALNEFTVTPGNDLITSISIAWARTGDLGYNGLSYEAILWQDSSGVGNPTGATLPTVIPGNVISGSGTNTFVTSTFSSPVLVTGTHFFVGFLITTAPGQSAIAGDTSMLLTNRSFYALNSAGAGDINNLSTNPSGILTFGPTFMIRADAVPEPSTNGLIFAGLVVAAGCFLRRSSMTARGA
jgi:hypothetical protein